MLLSIECKCKTSNINKSLFNSNENLLNINQYLYNTKTKEEIWKRKWGNIEQE